MSNDRILLVDDDEMIHLIVEEYLADFGYQIYKAKNSREGLEMIPKVKPDLILLDIGLPGQDGFQTLEEIKRTPVFSKIPVLFLTSYDRSSLKSQKAWNWEPMITLPNPLIKPNFWPG